MSLQNKDAPFFNKMKINIRKTQKKDREEIKDLVKKTWVDTYVYGNIKKEDILNFFKKSKKKLPIKPQIISPAYSNIHSYVAIYNKKIVGVLTLIEKKDYFYLKQLYILPSFQNKKIGSLLLRKAFSIASTSSKIHLEVASYNKKAIGFYKKNGFRRTRKKGDFLIGDKIIPLSFLYKKIG